MGAVVAAIDLGDSSRRVLHHAAGFARLLQESLRVLHVGADHARLVAFCHSSGPYEVNPDEQQLVTRGGDVVDTILQDAAEQHAALIVMGSRGHGRLTTLLLGSKCEALLQRTTVPVLLVPPTDVDIVNLSDGPALASGPILAAVDLAEANGRQLQVAQSMARISGQPLLLMTVAPSNLDAHEASQPLRLRAHQMPEPKPVATIVRRGNVAEEISRCAVTEGSGLVVMGVRPGSGAGRIASAVLRTNRAFVLAVPQQHQ